MYTYIRSLKHIIYIYIYIKSKYQFNMPGMDLLVTVLVIVQFVLNNNERMINKINVTSFKLILS